jgi:hypothetical protein
MPIEPPMLPGFDETERVEIGKYEIHKLNPVRKKQESQKREKDKSRSIKCGSRYLVY